MGELPLSISSGPVFLFVLLRTASFLSYAPLFGETQVPKRVRLGLAVMLSAALCLGAKTVPLGELSLSSLVGIALSETALGLAGGLCGRMVFEAASAAGYLAGASMGLGFGAPSGAGSDTPAVSRFVRLLTLGALVSLGAHREAIGWLYGTLRLYPPGSLVALLPLCSAVVHYALLSVTLTVRVVFPVLGASLLGHAVTGIAGRAAPQINLSNVGFSVTIFSGGVALYFVAPLIANAVAAQTVASVLP